MTGDVDQPNTPLGYLLEAGNRAEQARSARWAELWDDLIAADPRLSRLRDDPATRTEVEARLRDWENAQLDRRFYRDWTKAEVDALAGRVRAARDEISSVFDEVNSLMRLVESDAMWRPLDTIFKALLVSLDDLAPAIKAADDLTALPGRKGGRGAFTTEHRKKKPIVEFGEGMLPIFRRAGLPLGGNGSRDKAFATFLDTVCHHVTGAKIPGRVALLAELRKG